MRNKTITFVITNYLYCNHRIFHKWLQYLLFIFNIIYYEWKRYTSVWSCKRSNSHVNITTLIKLNGPAHAQTVGWLVLIFIRRGTFTNLLNFYYSGRKCEKYELESKMLAFTRAISSDGRKVCSRRYVNHKLIYVRDIVNTSASITRKFEHQETTVKYA